VRNAGAGMVVAAVVGLWAAKAIPSSTPAPAPAAALLPPPYRLFAGQSFEPSAAAYDPASGHVLVLSDHDTTLYRYRLTPAGLVIPRGERHEPLRLPEGDTAKFEGLTRLPSGDFLATTAFDRPDPAYRRVLRFSYRPGAPVEARQVAVDDAALTAVIQAATGLPWFKIEGVAVDPTGETVLFGVRCVGERYQEPRDVVLVVRCRLDGDRVAAPDAVVRLSTAESLAGMAEGLSDLQLDDGGKNFLVLTSHEGPDTAPDGHSGHLFRVPADVLLGAPSSAPVRLGAPLRQFRAKPEGLAVVPSGPVVVVFDDDREWKHLFAGYEQSDGLFAVVDARS
jgi:hypothetical protein